MPLDRAQLHQITAFEAAARHLSFSRAAQELNVQQPAISRRVAALEETLGVALFLRTKPRLTLTPEGEVLARATAKGFAAIEAGLAEVTTQEVGQEIVVNAPIGFTSLYLLPRLAEFQALHREVRVQVMTRDQSPDYDLARCDVVILFGDADTAGARSRQIFPECMVAVCNPAHLAPPVERPALADQHLLHMSGPAHVDDWTRYLEGSGASAVPPPPHDRLLSYMVYLRAIQNGLGIGIGWRPMIDDLLDSGELALACAHEQHTARGYFCTISPRGAARPEVQLFQDWLCTLEGAPRPR